MASEFAEDDAIDSWFANATAEELAAFDAAVDGNPPLTSPVEPSPPPPPPPTKCSVSRPQVTPIFVTPQNKPAPAAHFSVKTSAQRPAPPPVPMTGSCTISRPQESKKPAAAFYGSTKRSTPEPKDVGTFEEKNGADDVSAATGDVSAEPANLEEMIAKQFDDTDMGLDEEQASIVRAVKRGRNCFLTGQAGTGKTRVLKAIIKDSLKEKVNVSVIAHNGVAAANVGGMTIHSFFGISGTAKPPYSTKNFEAIERIMTAERLIFDEISTVDNHMLSGLDLFCRQTRKRMETPFGGIQVIACGDFAQLKPIDDSKKHATFIRNAKKKGEDVTDYVLQHSRDAEAIAEFAEYLEPAKTEVTYCFMSKAWKYVCQEIFMLTNIYRQTDPRYLKVLSEIRNGELSDETKNVLTSRLVCNVHIPGHDPEGSGFYLPEEYVVLYSRRADVDQYNFRRLSAITSDIGWNYKSLDRAVNPKLAVLLNNFQIPEQVLLKVGTRVMLKKNMNFKYGLVNGRCGRVIGFAEIFVRQLSTGLFRPIEGCVINRAMEPNEKPVTPTYEVPEEFRAPMPEEYTPGSVCPNKIVATIPKNMDERQACMGPSDPDLMDYEMSSPQRIGLLRGSGFYPLPVVHFEHGEVIVLTPLEWAIEEQRKMSKKKMDVYGIERTEKHQVVMEKVKIVSRIQVCLLNMSFNTTSLHAITNSS